MDAEPPTEKLSREYKSLINSAKESKIISECVSVDSLERIRKSRKDSFDPSIHCPQTDSNTSYGSDNSAKAQDYKRSMRSQNADFAMKQRKFLDTCTGKNFLESGQDEYVKMEGAKKDLKTVAKITDSAGNVKDPYCWHCHKDGADMIYCTICPRSFHTRCLYNKASNVSPGSAWACVECVQNMNADLTDNRSPAMSKVSLSKLTTLLEFALNVMESLPKCEPFMDEVDAYEFPNYTDYIVQPMYLKKLRENLNATKYGSTEAFLADARWILHNSIIYNSSQTELTSVAKSIMKICRNEMLEIETCPECYHNSKTKDDWFVQVCSKPHVLVWAKVKGFPHWPAKAMGVSQTDMVDVRFFGQHDRAYVRPNDCFLYSIQEPSSTKQRKAELSIAKEELIRHISKLQVRYGVFIPAPPKTLYSPHMDSDMLRVTLPNYTPKEGGMMVPVGIHYDSPDDKSKKDDSSSNSVASSPQKETCNLQPKVLLTSVSKNSSGDINNLRSEVHKLLMKAKKRKSGMVLEFGEVASPSRQIKVFKARSKSIYSENPVSSIDSVKIAPPKKKRSKSMCLDQAEYQRLIEKDVNDEASVTNSSVLSSPIDPYKFVLDFSSDCEKEPSETKTERLEPEEKSDSENLKQFEKTSHFVKKVYGRIKSKPVKRVDKKNVEERRVCSLSDVIRDCNKEDGKGTAKPQSPGHPKLRERVKSVDTKLMMCYREAVTRKLSKPATSPEKNDKLETSSDNALQIDETLDNVGDKELVNNERCSDGLTPITGDEPIEKSKTSDKDIITDTMSVSCGERGNGLPTDAVIDSALSSSLDNVIVQNVVSMAAIGENAVDNNNCEKPVTPKKSFLVGDENLSSNSVVCPTQAAITSSSNDNEINMPPLRMSPVILSSDHSTVLEAEETVNEPNKSNDTSVSEDNARNNISSPVSVVAPLSESPKTSENKIPSAQSSPNSTIIFPGSSTPNLLETSISRTSSPTLSIKKENFEDLIDFDIQDIQQNVEKQSFINSLSLIPSNNSNALRKRINKNISNLINGKSNSIDETIVKKVSTAGKSKNTITSSDKKNIANTEVGKDKGFNVIKIKKVESEAIENVLQLGNPTNKMTPEENNLNKDYSNKRKTVSPGFTTVKRLRPISEVSGRLIQTTNGNPNNRPMLFNNNKISVLNLNRLGVKILPVSGGKTIVTKKNTNSKSNNQNNDTTKSNVPSTSSGSSNMFYIQSDSLLLPQKNATSSRDGNNLIPISLTQSPQDAVNSAGIQLSPGNNILVTPLQSISGPLQSQATTSASAQSSQVGGGGIKVVPQSFLVNMPTSPCTTTQQPAAPPPGLEIPQPEDWHNIPVPPSRAGPISKILNENSFKMTQYFRHLLEESISSVGSCFSPEAQITSLKMQVERLKWHQAVKINELKHITDTNIKEIRLSLDIEKQREISEIKKQAEIDKIAAVRDAKKKQWCANCELEATLYCCRNTMYCDNSCQESHWPLHVRTCLRESEGNTDSILFKNLTAIPVPGSSMAKSIPVTIHSTRSTAGKRLMVKNITSLPQNSRLYSNSLRVLHSSNTLVNSNSISTTSEQQMNRTVDSPRIPSAFSLNGSNTTL